MDGVNRVDDTRVAMQLRLTNAVSSSRTTPPPRAAFMYRNCLPDEGAGEPVSADAGDGGGHHDHVWMSEEIAALLD